MKCERCKIPLVNLGEVKCATGDADRMGCGQCKAVWFRQKTTTSPGGEWTPLRVTMERILNMARADGLRASNEPVPTSFSKKPVEEYCI